MRPLLLPLAVLLPLMAGLGSACTSEEDDDDSAAEVSEAPEISGLSVEADGNFPTGPCELRISVNVDDPQGDLQGGQAAIEFVGSGVGGGASFTADLDNQENATSASIHVALTLPDQLEFDASFDDLTYLLTDAAGNASNLLSYGPIAMPDSSCVLP